MKDVFAIAFSLSKSWSYKSKKEAIDEAGSFEALIQDSKKKIESLDAKTAENQVKKLQKQNGWLWIYGEKNYPSILSKIPDPPLVVYGLGNPIVDEENTLAFIGTRNPTPYGNRIALMLAKDLVREGLTLVSGLARGIDSIGHKVSIDAKSPTIAVLAHGLDTVYPQENKKVAQKIIDTGGALISEFPLGIKPLAPYFPQRNRIISGLARAVLVIEAGEKSGTRLTVNHALEQSREVFAVPGPIDSEYSTYTNELIFSGANMIRTSLDILDFYPRRKTRSTKKTTNVVFKPNPIQSQILDFLDENSPKSLDELMSKSSMDAKEILQNMTELELHGKVLKTMGSMYILSGIK